MAASGRKVSRTNQAAGKPIRSLPKSGPSPVVRRAQLKPRSSLPVKPLDNAADFVGKAVGAAAKAIQEDGRRAAQVAKDPKAPAPERLLAQAAPITPGGTAVRGASLGAKSALRGVFARTGESVTVKAGKKTADAAKKVKNNPKPLRKQAADAAKKTKKKAKRTAGKAKTSEGRKQLGKDAAKATGRGAKGAAKGTAKAVARSKTPPAAVGIVGANDLSGGNNEISRVLSDDIKGTVDAVVDDPVKTGVTTARVIPGAIAGLGKAAGAVGETAYRGARKGIAQSPDPLASRLGRNYTGKEVASPVVNSAKETAEGVKQMAEPFIKGDREAVKKTVQEDLGLAPIVFGPRAVKAVRRSKGYQGARGVARDARAASREKKRQKLRKQKKREEKSVGQSDVIVPPKARRDTRSRRGDEYFFQGAGKFIENRRTGRREKMTQERNLRPVEREISHLTKQLGAAIAATGARGTRQKDKVAAAVTLATREPITRGKTTESLTYLKDKVLGSKKKPKRSSQPGANYDPQVIKFIENNLGLTLENPKFWDAVDLQLAISKAGTTRSKGEGAGQRARYAAAADAYGIKGPKKRMKEGIIVEGRVVKSKPMKPADIERKLAKAKNQSVKARNLDRRIAKLPEDSPKRASLIRKREQAQRKGDKLRKEVRDNRIAYTAAERKMVGATRAAIKRDGLDPDNIGYVREAQRIGPSKVGKAGVDSFFRGNVIADQLKTGALRRENRADLSLDTTVRETNLRPRMMEAVNAATRQFVARYAVPIKTKRRGKTVYATAAEWERAYQKGSVPAGTVLVHSQFVQGAFRGNIARGDSRSIDGPSGGVGGVPIAEVGAKIRGRAADKGHKYVAVNGKAWDEFMFQMGAPRGLANRAAARTNRIASTAILGYNPSWAAAQVLAEGLPALASIGLSPGAWQQVLQAGRAYKQESPQVKAQIDAVSGQAGGTLRAFGNARGAGNTPDYSLAPAFVKRSTNKMLPWRRPNGADMDDVVAGFSQKALRQLKDAAKGRSLNEFVLWLGGKYRRGVMNAEIYRRQQKGITSLARATLMMRRIDKNIKAMSPAEAQRYFTKNPDQAARIADYMEDVMGNWTALSKTEGAIAPYVAFYPYLRYSIRWTFYGFPSRHPIKAQMLYWLAQQNSNELEEMVGGKVGDWLDYAFPVVTADGQKERMKGAARFQPALSVLVEALGTDKPERLVGGINPIVGAIRTGIQGTTGLSSNQVAFGFKDQALLGFAALANMVAPVRWSDEMVEGGTIRRITPRRDYGAGYMARKSVVDNKRSAASEAFRAADPGARINGPLDLFRSRSSFNIMRRQTASDARKENELKLKYSGQEQPKKKARRQSSSSSSSSRSSSGSPTRATGGSSSGGFGGFKPLP